jgi:hypothetical protein
MTFEGGKFIKIEFIMKYITKQIEEIFISGWLLQIAVFMYYIVACENCLARKCLLYHIR